MSICFYDVAEYPSPVYPWNGEGRCWVSRESHPTVATLTCLVKPIALRSGEPRWTCWVIEASGAIPNTGEPRLLQQGEDARCASFYVRDGRAAKVETEYECPPLLEWPW